MATLEDRVYELGLAALGEQERQALEMRGRGATILASGAVVASLLAKPVFHGRHPSGWLAILATGVGLVGVGGVLVFVVLLLRPTELGFSVKASDTYRSLWQQEITEQPMVDLALADAFEQRREVNADAVSGLARSLRLALLSLVLETAGLALAAAISS